MSIQMDFSKILARTMQKTIKPSEPLIVSSQKSLEEMTPEELQDDIYDCYQCGPPKEVHLTPQQQKIMNGALRDSLEILDEEEAERTIHTNPSTHPLQKRCTPPWEKDYMERREHLKTVGDYVRKIEAKLGRDAHFSMCAEMHKDGISVNEAVKRMKEYFRDLYKDGDKRRHF